MNIYICFIEVLYLNSNCNTEFVKFPKNLKEIHFGDQYNKPIKALEKCLMLKKVKFGKYFGYYLF